MCHEIRATGMRFDNQLIVPILYKGSVLGEHRIDLLVENEILVELKAVERMDPVFKAQILSYMRMTNKKLGLLINFNVPYLKEGIQRVIL
jgi:GxxExxY protein